MLVAAILIFAALGAVLPLYLISEIPAFRVDDSVLILYLGLLYAAGRLGWLAYLGERRLLTLTFWLFVYVWGLLSAMLQAGADLFPWKRYHSDTEQAQTALLLLFALMTFEVGGLIAHWRERRLSPGLAWTFTLRGTLVFGIGAVIIAAIAIVELGGVSAALQSRATMSATFWREGGSTAARNLLEAALRSAPYVACLTLLFTLQRRWPELSRQGRLLMIGVFLLVLPVALVTNYPDALTRGWLGTVALSFAFLLLPWRRWTLAGVVPVLIAAFVFVFPHSDHNRTRQEVPAVAAPTVSPVMPLLVKGDYDVFVQFVNARIYVHDKDYTYGRNLLGSALFWFPRQWWPDKPLNSGFEIGLHLQNSTINLSAPLWAEGYLAFGWIGMALLMGGYGYLVGVIDRRYVRQIKDGIEWGVLRIFVPFWAAYQVFFLRGPLMHTIAYASFTILLFLLMVRWRADLKHTPSTLR